jgi:hypothetical protein
MRDRNVEGGGKATLQWTIPGTGVVVGGLPLGWGIAILLLFLGAAWLLGFVPPGRSQTIAASAYEEQEGVTVATDKEREGMVLSQGDAGEASRVVYRFWSVPCVNRMPVEYASGERRPVHISVNGTTIAADALSKITGPPPVPQGPAAFYLIRRETVGVGAVSLGFENEVEIMAPGGSPFPHLVKLIFVCAHFDRS